MDRREYSISFTVNGIAVNKIIIDPHYEQNHSASINDPLILRLVLMLDGGFYEVDAIDPPYSYFATDGLLLDGKTYKLIWLIDNYKIYVGVINAYRR